jgi:hypothetical protein
MSHLVEIDTKLTFILNMEVERKCIKWRQSGSILAKCVDGGWVAALSLAKA